ncbi:MAG: hypothetical protein A2X42_01195 [Candidatus Margulisbacteria bacterium GWF2_38_17]|nr:MAG: hypothetical protein A2X43_04860 [Candidatus Margulisbacteria bacterium GWD2_39_127]OGI03628.1 MAG: hypothetical protein A2X42_01195 [Candidatus Margulisbacteria bacterium GWF2_38_17]OGI11132.1 MAG: hypothetical protein A2X41_02490 [Candidatus Margulisbacteria bacterium GWE2_39_32]
MIVLLTIALRNLWRRKVRTLIVISTITIGLWGLIVIFSLSRGIIEQMVENAIFLDVGQISIQHNKFLTQKLLEFHLPDSIYGVVNKIRQLGNVKAVSMRLQVQGLVSSTVSSAGIVLSGIDPGREKQVTIVSNYIQSGQYLQEKDQNKILLSQKLAEKLGVTLGDKVVFMAQGANGDIVGSAYRIGGIYSTDMPEFDQGNAFVLLKPLQELLQTRTITEVAIVLHDEAQLSTTKRKIAELVPKTELVRVYDWKERFPILVRYQEIFAASMWIYYIIIFLAVAMAILNIFFAVVYERIREYGILKSIGTSEGFIFFLIITEAAFIGIFSLISGIAIAYLTIRVLMYSGIDLSVFSGGLKEFGLPVKIYPKLGVLDFFVPVVVTMVTCILSAVYPAWRASRLKPAEAMRFI